MIPVTNGMDVVDDVSEADGVVGDSTPSEFVSDNRFLNLRAMPLLLVDCFFIVKLLEYV